MAVNTQARILRCSMELFREKGFNNAAIKDIYAVSAAKTT